METILVTVLRQKVLHDGVSMLVLKPGADNPPVPVSQIAALVDEGFIEKPDGWEAPIILAPVDLEFADGAVFSDQPEMARPVTTDLVRGVTAPAAGSDLESQSLASLIAIASTEGVIPDAEEMRLSLVEAIRAKREGGEEFGSELLDAEGDGVEKVAIPAERAADGSVAGEAQLGSEGDNEGTRLPQLDHDGDGEAGGSKPKDPPSLSGKNKTELTAIAADEGVTLEEGMTGKQMVAAIAAKRAEVAAAADDTAGEGDAPA